MLRTLYTCMYKSTKARKSILALSIYFTNCFCEVTATVSSALNDAVNASSIALKVCVKSDERYMSTITTPIDLNIDNFLQLLLHETDM